jgi:hypothetical protein
MTITQDKYCYTDTNPDGSHTIKGILEFTDLDGKDKACVFRVHLESRTILLSELVGLHYSSLAENDIIPNLIWKQYLESTGIQPADLRWIKHGGTFDGCSGSSVDIRYPYRAVNPKTKRPRNDYDLAFTEWNGNKFELSQIRLKQNRIVLGKSEIQVFQSHFGTVEEITDHFNWRKGVNRLDLEYRVDRLNSDGSKTIKTIYHWDHSDYPSHCLLRILLHPKKAIIIMSSLQSNISPHQSYRNESNNSLYKCLIQVVNGILQKYNYELSQYQKEDTVWIYEWGEFTDPGDYRDVWHVPSYFQSVNLVWNGSTLDYLYSEDDEDNDNYSYIETKPQIDFFRSSRFGTVEESLAELGWFNR